jgi:hypothetical protein
MAITTLVPFIKSGIPRLSEFDVKEAKLWEKEYFKKHKLNSFSSKLFSENLVIRDEILRQYRATPQEKHLDHSPFNLTPEKSHSDKNIKIEDKKEFTNISNNPEIKNDENRCSNSNIDIEAELKKSVDETANKTQAFSKEGTSDTPEKALSNLGISSRINIVQHTQSINNWNVLENWPYGVQLRSKNKT